MKKELFRTFNLTLAQNGNPILSNMFFQIFDQEHTGILFNSFKERDTFLAFLEGTLPPVQGSLYFEEQALSYAEYIDTARKNIAIVKETSRLMDSLSVYENLFYEQLSMAWLTARKYRIMTVNLLSHFHLALPATRQVGLLSQYERLALELIKAFSQKKKLIFLSNISSLLDSGEFRAMLNLLQMLHMQGTTFIISETFDTQLFQMGDTLHIVKNGRIIRILEHSEIQPDKIRKSLGSHNILNRQQASCYKPGQENLALEFRDVTDKLLNHLSFSLKRGGILKILCSSSRVATHICSLAEGSLLPLDGEIQFYGQSLQTVEHQQYRKQYGLITSNPRQTMILHNMTVLDNLCLSLDKKTPGFLASTHYKKGIAYALKDILDPVYFPQNIDEVPLNIVQLTIYCRWLLYVPDLLICVNPFSINDSSLNMTTKQMLNLLTGKGIPVLIIANNWSMDIDIDGETLFL